MKTKKLLDVSYYVSKLSLAMQNDELTLAKVRSACEILQRFDNTITSLKSAMNELMSMLINDNGLESIPSYQYTDLLDKIAACFNLNRVFVVDFTDENGEKQTIWETKFNDFNATVAGDKMSTKLHLSNNQLRVLIFCAIMKNSYDGSYEMLSKAYDVLFNRLIAADVEEASSWHIYQVTSDHAECMTTFVFTNLPSNEQVVDENGFVTSNWNYFTLYFANMLTIMSIGVYYLTNAANFELVLKWKSGFNATYEHVVDDPDANMYWDFYNADPDETNPAAAGSKVNLWL